MSLLPRYARQCCWKVPHTESTAKRCKGNVPLALPLPLSLNSYNVYLLSFPSNELTHLTCMFASIFGKYICAQQGGNYVLSQRILTPKDHWQSANAWGNPLQGVLFIYFFLIIVPNERRSTIRRRVYQHQNIPWCGRSLRIQLHC